MLSTTAIILMEGSSRSGKSSICEAIQQYNNYEAVSSLYLYYCHDIFRTISSDAFICLQAHVRRENITHAITKNIFVFKDNVSENDKNEAKKAARDIQNHFNDPAFCAKHMEEFSTFALSVIKGHLNNGLNVLTDGSWYVTPKRILEIMPDTKSVSILAYCPFNTIIERILYRNKACLESGDLTNYRFFREPLKSFEELYDFTAETTASIDTLEKVTFLSYLEKIELSLSDSTYPAIASDFVAQDFTQKTLNEYRHSFLEKFENKELLHIVPKKPYEVILKTHIYTPQDCASQIVAYVDDLLRPNP